MRLCAHFFQPSNAGEPVTFFIDDEIVWRQAGTGSAAEGVERLVSAVKSKLGTEAAGNVFRRVQRDCLAWKRLTPEECPPSLPLLAVAVLAAAHMARTESVPAHNYYHRFRQLLGLDGSGMPNGYDEAIPMMWRHLDWWLDDQKRGHLGASTITEHYHYVNIGYALSQALFRESDRQQLTQFFRWLGLRPGDSIEPAELLSYYRAWAAGSSLSHGARTMAQDAHFAEQLERTLRLAFSAWDGSVRDEAGRRTAEIVITLCLGPRPTMGLAAECPEGFPRSGIFTAPTGQQIQLFSSAGGWYDDLPLKVTPELLSSGFKLSTAELALLLKPEPIVPLQQNYDLGCWSSVSRLAPSELHWILAAEPERNRVSAYLQAHARSGWSERRGVAPQGWTLFADVLIDGAPVGDGSALSRLTPSVQARPALWGGLPLGGHSTYLAGGEPDLWIPPAAPGAAAIEVAVDGTMQQIAPGGGRIELRALDLPAGPHEVRIGPSRLAFQTVASVGVGMTAGTATLAHSLQHRQAGYEALSLGASAWDGEAVPGEIRVAGAIAYGRPEDLPPFPVPPLVLPRRAQDYILLGSRPGEIQRPTEARPPGWMEQFSLHPGFEVQPAFPVVWIVIAWEFRNPTIRLREPLEPTMDPVPDASSAAIDDWATQLLRPGPTMGSSEAVLWERYQEVAEGLGAV